MLASLASVALIALAGSAAADSKPAAARPAAHMAPFVMASPLAGSFDWSAPFAIADHVSSQAPGTGQALAKGAMPARALDAPKSWIAFAQSLGARTYAYLAGLTGHAPARPGAAKA